ncbi:MAG: hypothetical protein O3B13_05595 [Planctomycetota bacterium]|nr:hypothetical protein [Planctomycetota bacterium]MDA1162552.1 hypothetical protein [Planctomycetota bacterium]
MTRYFTLLLAAYGLLAIESSLRPETGLVTPHGSFVWMLLPWLATLPNTTHAVLAATIYGLTLDAFSSHQPGLLMAVTIVATCVLQRAITAAALETSSRIFIVSFVCGCLMAMLVAASSILAGASTAAPEQLAASIAISSALAAAVMTIVVAAVLSILRIVSPVRNPAH